PWTWLAALILCGAVGSLVSLSGSPLGIVAVALGVLGYVLFAASCVRAPFIFITTFLLVLEVLPPFFFPQTGDRPVYLSFFLLPIGLAIFLVRFPEMTLPEDPIGIGLALFVGGTAVSLPFAWWLSGPEAGMEGLWRWLLLSQAALIYY